MSDIYKTSCYDRFPMENNRGFSLVELMVVVAIIGILAAIGIPNFKRYQAKSKASEARIKLAAVYTAETNLQAEYDAFATCLNFAGYDPGGFNVSTYYAVGFSVPVGAANLMVVNNGGANCNVAPGNQTGFNGIKRVGNAPTPAMIMDIQQASPGNIGTALDGSTFMAGAIGPISPDVDNTNRANWSRWTINHNKQLVEQNPGY